MPASQSAGNVNASPNNTNLENRIIPVLNKGLPPASWWDLGMTTDKRSGSNEVRIWSFDDQNELDCGSIVCSRDSNSEAATAHTDLIEEDGASFDSVSTKSVRGVDRIATFS